MMAPGPRLGVATALLALTACGGESAPVAPARAPIELGEVVVGDEVEARLTVARTAGLVLEVDHSDLSARISSPTQVVLRYAPRAAGPLEARLVLTWPDEGASASVAVRGAARWPAVLRAPEVAAVPEGGFVDVWLWPEAGLPVRLAEGSGLPACPGAPCVELIADRVDRGLPATVRVRLPEGGFLPETASFTVEVCPAPECRIEVPVRAASEPALSFAAAPVGQASLRTLPLPGREAPRVSSPALQIVDSSTSALTVRWTPTEAGPLEAEVSRGGETRAVLGYAVEAGPCSSEVAPAPLVFGAAAVGGFLERTVTVRNRGPEACLWSGLGAQGAAFSAPELPPRWLEPGESAQVDLRFTPRAEGRAEGRLALWLSDVPGAGRDVALAGHGVTSDLELVTEALDFGEVGGCRRYSRPLYVLNRGHAPGRIVAARFFGPGAEHLELPTPTSVPPSGLTAFGVVLREDTPAAVDATLAVTLEDDRARTSYELPVRARPEEGVWVEDRFETLGYPKTDYLLALDPAAGRLGPALQANLTYFQQFLRAQQLDHRLAVVDTAPEGRGLEPHPLTGQRVFEDDDQDFFGPAFLETALAVPARTSRESAGLARAYEVLTSTAVAEWVREDAVLGVIVVSPRRDASGGEVSEWINRFLLIKGFRNTNLFFLSAIVGDPDAGCEAEGFTAEPGPRYVELARSTGGVYQSICTADWSRALEDLATVAFGFKSRYFLTHQPIEGTISLFVDTVGVPATRRDGTRMWNYDFATNSINFSPFATPPPGAEILVRYQAICL